MPVKVTAVTPPRPSTAARRREARGRAQAHRQAAALYDAIKRNSVAAATEALDGGATPHQDLCGLSGWTALHIAAMDGDTALCELFLDRGAEPEARDSFNRLTPLHYASSYGHAAAAALLVRRGADARAADKDGQTPLMHAAGFGHVDTVLALVHEGGALDAQDISGDTALHIAAKRGQPAVLESLLAEPSAPADVRNDAGETAAGIMARKAAELAAKEAVVLGDEEAGELLYEAIKKGDVEAAAAALDNGATVHQDLCGLTGWTALHIAAKAGDTALCELFLDRGAAHSAQDSFNRLTPLHYASSYGHTAAMTLLMRRGADANMKDKEGQTALMLASKHGKIETMGALLRVAGFVELQTQSVCGDTALHLAAKFGQAGAMELLEAAGSPDEIRNDAGDTAADILVARELREAIKEADVAAANSALEAGATLHQKLDAHQHTALHLAAKAGSRELCAAFLDRRSQSGSGGDGAAGGGVSETDSFWASLSREEKERWLRKVKAPPPPELELTSPVARREKEAAQRREEEERRRKDAQETSAAAAGGEARDFFGQTALHLASGSGHAAVVRLLAWHDAVANVADREGVTPLMLACLGGHTDAAQELLRGGAGLDAQNDKGLTALHCAAKEGRLEAARLLLTTGADVGLRDKDGKTAADLAAACRKLYRVVRGGCVRNSLATILSINFLSNCCKTILSIMPMRSDSSVFCRFREIKAELVALLAEPPPVLGLVTLAEERAAAQAAKAAADRAERERLAALAAAGRWHRSPTKVRPPG